MSIDFHKLITFAFCVALLCSCSKENGGVSGEGGRITVDLTLSGEVGESQGDESQGSESPGSESKAYVSLNSQDNRFWTTWEVGDSLSIWFDGVAKGKDYTFINTVAFELCSFSGKVSETAGSHRIYGCYPSGAVVGGSETNVSRSVRMTLPVQQVPMWGSSDGAADWLIMKPADITVSASSQQLDAIRFARVNSMVKFVPTDASSKGTLGGENIIKTVLRITNVPLAGTATVSLEDASVSAWTQTADSVKAVYGKYDQFTVGNGNAVFYCVKPSVIAAGTQMELTVITTGHKASKTVSAKAMEFPAGGIATISVSYSDSDIVTWSEPEPEPEPEPVVSNLPKWAESPSTPEKTGDYYYTWHITDVNDAKGSKARNYCCCYSKEYMCPVWVAAPYHDFYAKKNTSRTDAYKTDPNFNFTQAGKWDGYTRGHMLGSAERLVSKLTNQQVFYYSNIAPQLQTYFNTGGGVWNICEDNFCDPQWSGKMDTTYIVTGCWWDSSAKYSSGSRIPTHYYKILLRTKNHSTKYVCDCSSDELQCIAVIFEHKTYSKGHGIVPSTYESRGLFRTVKQMEELTGFTFFPNVPNAPKDKYDAGDWL